MLTLEKQNRELIVRRRPTVLALPRGNFYTVPMRIRISSRILVWLFVSLAIFELSALPLSADDQFIALKASRLFDGKSRTLTQNGVVIVQGDKIIDVGSNITIPADAKVIDLGDATLSPGFMDAHSHLTLDYSGDFNKRRLEEVDLNVSGFINDPCSIESTPASMASRAA